ncbi:MAG: hypothetical protein A4S09_10165 [Proteobacteria bacterium SG_bin7]|nr:MAG: hypothetical protein A4S09_10165 [Proteobacteria bacterium SG_bin7]
MIIWYHGHETIFQTQDFNFTVDDNFSALLLPLCRLFCLSGIAAITISAFLIGFTQKHLPRRIIIYSAVGMLLVGFTQGGFFQSYFLEWDVYQFIFFSFITLVPISRSKTLMKIGLGIGTLTMFFNWWEISALQELPLLLQHVLIGVCDHVRAGWPLLPWLGLIWMYYGFGFYSKEKIDYLPRWNKIEWFFWVPLGLWCAQYIGAYYNVKFNSEFYCYIFRQGMEIFWGNWFWLTLFLRLAFLDSVNNYLAQIKFVRWLSRLHWNQHFGRVYLIQFFWLALFGTLAPYIRQHPRLFDFYLIAVVLMAELSSRLWTFGCRFKLLLPNKS